jgi:hypothetical protein
MLRHATEVRPPSYQARLALAQFYLAPEHRNEAAAEMLGRGALNLDTERVDAYCVLAEVLLQPGELECLGGNPLIRGAGGSR